MVFNWSAGWNNKFLCCTTSPTRGLPFYGFLSKYLFWTQCPKKRISLFRSLCLKQIFVLDKMTEKGKFFFSVILSQTNIWIFGLFYANTCKIFCPKTSFSWPFSIPGLSFETSIFTCNILRRGNAQNNVFFFPALSTCSF